MQGLEELVSFVTLLQNKDQLLAEHEAAISEKTGSHYHRDFRISPEKVFSKI